MTPQNQKDIKTIAERINRMLNDTGKLPYPSMFWDDLGKLVELILEEKGE